MITLATLKRLGACQSWIDMFLKVCPDGTNPTSIIDARALAVWYASQIDWEWCAEHLLSPDKRRAYDEAIAPATRAYREACDAARHAFNEAIASVRSPYYEACDSGRRAYREACDSAGHAYDKVITPANRAYDEAIAVAFVKEYYS